MFLRISIWPVFASFCLLLASCAEEKAAEKSSHENAVSSRQEIALRLAHATENTGDLAAAEKLYLHVISSYPSRVEPHIELAEFYRRHNNTPQAIGAYNDALKLDPENVTLLRDMANTYINAGQTHQAVETLDRAIVINGKDPLLYNSKGVALDMEGHYALAQQSYRKALELDPGDAMTFDANLSMSYNLSGQYNQTISLLRPLLYNPDVTPTIRQNLAMAYGMKGEKDNALKLGLKDLTPEQANENLKFYGMVSRAQPVPAKPVDSTAMRSTIRDVFPEDDTATPSEATSAPVLSAGRAPTADIGFEPSPGLIHNTLQEPPLPASSASLPAPVLKDTEQEDDAYDSAAPVTAVTIPAQQYVQLPPPLLKPQ